MSNTSVPKVSITESIGSKSANSQGGLNTVIPAFIGTSEKGTANQIYTFNSISEAELTLGSNTAHGANLIKMIRKAFDEGASKVIGISVGTPTLDADANDAITADLAVGWTTVTVGAGASDYADGDIVYLGTDSDYEYEERFEVASVTATEVVLTTGAKFKHYIGETLQKVTEKVASGYQTAITALESDEDKSIVVCELNDDTVAGYINTMLENSYNNYATPCIYIRWPEDDDDASGIATKGVAVNNDRVILPYPNLVAFSTRVLTGGETAAAVAGLLARNGIPKLNHNFSTFTSVGGVASKITDFDALLNAGVTPLALKYDDIYLIRFLTSYSKLNGVPDTTRKEGAIRTNVDYIQRAIQRRLQTKFLQSGNTEQTRLAIKMETVALLETFKNENILIANETTWVPAYKQPVVATDATDDTQVNVQVELSPGKPLNFIKLEFKIML